MRFIRKSLNNSPYKFIHKTFKSSNQTKVSWKNYRDKGALLRELINEQFGLCAYSEIELNKLNKDSYDAHIEHVKPKVKCPERIFDYFNIVASALHSNSLKKITTPECFAGHAKGGKYDQNLFLSPLARSSAKYFIYLSDGRVVPSNNLDDDGVKMAKYTINLLNLNCEYLKNRRNLWLDEIDILIDQYLDDVDTLKILCDCELGITNGKIRSFHTAMRQRFGSISEKVIEDNYPQIL